MRRASLNHFLRTLDFALATFYLVAFVRVVSKVYAFEIDGFGGAVMCLVLLVQVTGHVRSWSWVVNITAAVAVLGVLLMIPYLMGILESALLPSFWIRAMYTLGMVLVAVLCVLNAVVKARLP